MLGSSLEVTNLKPNIQQIALFPDPPAFLYECQLVKKEF